MTDENNIHMKEKKVFKVLAIDGGGIKGLYSARILEHFENRFNGAISDHFDLICGTSTGGLITLALSLGIPANEISQFYIDKGPKIFPNQNKIVALLKQVLLNGKYKDHNFKKALNDIFGDKKIEDVNNLICIPSYSLTDARPWVFKYDHYRHNEDSLSRDNKTSCVDVALATSAAPTYLPIAELPIYDNRQFVDGGVWANNPTLVGFIEALKFFVGEGKEYDSLMVLSISSLSLTGGLPIGLKRDRSFLHWRENLLDTFMTGQSLFTNYFMDTIKEVNDVSVNYVRVPSASISSVQEHLVQLDNASKKSLDFLSAKGNDQGEFYKKKKEIKQFFETKKTYKI